MVLAVLVKVSAAGFALKLATERAVELIALTWYLKAHSLVQVAGLDGLSSLLGCVGLCLAFLCVACGIAMGSGATMMMRKKQSRLPLETGCMGLTVFLGCGIAGALLGSASTALMALGLRGLSLSGFILSLTLLLRNKHQQQIVATPATMLTLPAVTFITMLLGVWSGQAIDTNKPRLCLVMILLLPAGILMGFLADILAFRKPSAYVTLSIMLLIPLTGLLLGLGIESDSSETPLFYETFYTTQSLVYTLEMLTGLIGALFGVMSVSLWEVDRAEGLSLWISVPTAVILYTLEEDTQHMNLRSLIERCLGAGGEFGLISGLAAASGVSLGLVVMSTIKQLWRYAVLILGVVFLAVDSDLLSFTNIVEQFSHELLYSTETTMDQDSGIKVSMLLEAALRLAILGVVMMGATVLGAAGLLTAALGSAGHCGVALAIQITIMKSINVFTGHR